MRSRIGLLFFALVLGACVGSQPPEQEPEPPTDTTDTDGDGIFDVLESATLDSDGDGIVDRYDSNNTSPFGDQDGDGISNLNEKLVGTDPLDPVSGLLPTMILVETFADGSAVGKSGLMHSNKYYPIFVRGLNQSDGGVPVEAALNYLKTLTSSDIYKGFADDQTFYSVNTYAYDPESSFFSIDGKGYTLWLYEEAGKHAFLGQLVPSLGGRNFFWSGGQDVQNIPSNEVTYTGLFRAREGSSNRGGAGKFDMTFDLSSGTGSIASTTNLYGPSGTLAVDLGTGEITGQNISLYNNVGDDWAAELIGGLFGPNADAVSGIFWSSDGSIPAIEGGFVGGQLE